MSAAVAAGDPLAIARRVLAPDHADDDTTARVGRAISAAMSGALVRDATAPTAGDWRKLARDLGRAARDVEGAMLLAARTWSPSHEAGYMRIREWDDLRAAIEAAALLSLRVYTLEDAEVQP